MVFHTVVHLRAFNWTFQGLNPRPSLCKVCSDFKQATITGSRTKFRTLDYIYTRRSKKRNFLNEHYVNEMKNYNSELKNITIICNYPLSTRSHSIQTQKHYNNYMFVIIR